MNRTKKSSASESSTISSSHILAVVEQLQAQTVHESTTQNYLSIWRHFNNFLIKLDKKPEFWEDRVVLFCTYLIEQGTQSSTIKLYVSAIKKMLTLAHYQWNNNQSMLESLIKACRLKNDRLKCRLPIHKSLFELLLFELGRILHSQIYLCALYRATFSLAYYGLMRVGELAKGIHSIKACDIHLGKNKDKILIILYTSKTHSRAIYPQKIKISSFQQVSCWNRNGKVKNSPIFCPFKAIRQFLQLRGDYVSQDENFLVFSDKSPITPDHLHRMLRKLLIRIGLQADLYNFHSFRIGRSSDLMLAAVPVETIKQLG